MKIIHCLNQYMPMAEAGTEIYTHTLATKQKVTGHNVAVITPHIEYYRSGQMREHYLYDEIDVYQYLETGDPTDRQIHYGYKKPAGLENFKQLLIKLSPDVIHFQELNRSIGFTVEHVKIAKQYGAKVILTVHLSSYTCNTNILVRDGEICDGKIREKTCVVCSYKTLFHVPSMISGPLASVSIFSHHAGLTKKLKPGKATTLMNVPSVISRIKKELKQLSENLDQFVCLAEWYKKILLENGVPENKITVLPPSLVTKKDIKSIKIYTQVQLPVKMVFIGRLQPTKGIHLIIDALKHFSANQVVIDLYGKEEDSNYYRNCKEDSKHAANINWQGPIDRSKVVEILSQYDMLCLASTFSEMAPLVIQEAFAAGLPVLASNVCGNKGQIAENHNGLLFDFNSSKSLQKKIQMLIDNPGLIQRLKNNVVSPASFTVVHESYLQLYTLL